MTETLRTVDGRYVLRIERRLAHAPENVWRALTEPAHLNQWFPFDVEMDLRIDGEINFIEKTGEGPTTGGVITELDPSRVLAYSWEGELLRFELRPDRKGCLLIFTHTFDDRAGAASFASGWHVCLDAMNALLDGRPVEFPDGNFPELHEAYVEAFGLNVGSAEESADGWRVRFERQLTQPIDKVWATLTAFQRDAPASDVSASVIGGPAPPAFTTPRVPAGAVTAIDPPTLLEYDWRVQDRPAGRVRWELSQGTGHGARLLLTQTGPSELAEERSNALAAWQTHIERLAKRLQGDPLMPHG